MEKNKDENGEKQKVYNEKRKVQEQRHEQLRVFKKKEKRKEHTRMGMCGGVRENAQRRLYNHAFKSSAGVVFMVVS